MNTVLKNWCLVDVTDGDNHIGSVIWGKVVDDSSVRFLVNDYICTSQITKVYHQLITTSSNSIYQVLGKGQQACIEYDDFELLRNGFNPQQINELRELATKRPH